MARLRSKWWLLAAFVAGGLCGAVAVAFALEPDPPFLISVF